MDNCTLQVPSSFEYNVLCLIKIKQHKGGLQNPPPHNTTNILLCLVMHHHHVYWLYTTQSIQINIVIGGKPPNPHFSL